MAESEPRTSFDANFMEAQEAVRVIRSGLVRARELLANFLQMATRLLCMISGAMVSDIATDVNMLAAIPNGNLTWRDFAKLLFKYVLPVIFGFYGPNWLTILSAVLTALWRAWRSAGASGSLQRA
ncbi:uncharacterized protein EI90DRAFT_3091775, partial [Cantharellus anzutake]|uniref:uncharacterized protein n=1 Tax=Cantharellus anzutake TaxID=1750568 RepID=UPI0019058335